MYKYELILGEDRTIPARISDNHESRDGLEQHLEIFDILEEELPNGEISSGVHWISESKITNNSTSIFPGGTLTEIEFEQPIGGNYSVSRELDDIPIPELEPEEEFVFSLDLGIPKMPGTAQVTVQLESPVDVGFVGKEDNDYGESLFYTFSVVDREKLRMLNRLGEISNSGGN